MFRPIVTERSDLPDCCDFRRVRETSRFVPTLSWLGASPILSVAPIPWRRVFRVTWAWQFGRSVPISSRNHLAVTSDWFGTPRSLFLPGRYHPTLRTPIDSGGSAQGLPISDSFAHRRCSIGKLRHPDFFCHDRSFSDYFWHHRSDCAWFLVRPFPIDSGWRPFPIDSGWRAHRFRLVRGPPLYPDRRTAPLLRSDRKPTR